MAASSKRNQAVAASASNLRCAACDYDLQGTEPRGWVYACPECGATNDIRDLVRAHERRRAADQQFAWAAIAGLLTLTALTAMWDGSTADALETVLDRVRAPLPMVVMAISVLAAWHFIGRHYVISLVGRAVAAVILGVLVGASLVVPAKSASLLPLLWLGLFHLWAVMTGRR